MKSKLILAAAMLALTAPVVTAPAQAQVLIDVGQITCGEYLKSNDADRILLSAFVGGYFNSSRNLTLIQSAYVKRNHEVIVKYCEEHKSAKLLDSVMKEFH
jgi:acid stress chaperone HdeB